MNSFLHRLIRRPKTNDSNSSQNEHDQSAVTLDRHMSLTALTCLSISNSIGSGKFQFKKKFWKP